MGDAEFAGERLAARDRTSAGDCDDLRLAHFAAAGMLEEKLRDDPAAEEADPHFSRAALFS